MNKRFAFVLLFVLLNATSKAQDSLYLQPYTQDTLALPQLYEAIWQNHPLIQKAKLIPQLALQDLRKARGLFEPTIMGDWTEKEYKQTTYYEKLLAEVKVPTILGFDLKAGYENNSGKYLGNESTVPAEGLFYAGIDIPLMRNLIFDERRAALRQAQIFVEMSEAEQQKELNKLFFSIAKDYWEWQAAHQRLKVTQEAVELAQMMFKNTKESFLLGKYRAIDTTESLMNLQKQQIMLQQAVIDYEKTRLALSRNIWSEDGQPLYIKNTVIPSAKGSEVESFDVQELLAAAAEAHPELLKQRFKLRSLEIDKRLYQFSLMPKLDLSYKPILYPQGSTASEGNLPLTEDYKLGIKLYTPLFFRKERGSLAAARIKIRQQELDLSYTQRSIQIGIEQAYIQVRQYEQMLITQTKNVENARILREGEQTLFELGKSNVFLINYRQQYYLDAVLKLIDLRMKYAKAKAELMWSAGKNQFIDLNIQDQ